MFIGLWRFFRSDEVSIVAFESEKVSEALDLPATILEVQKPWIQAIPLPPSPLPFF